jgi:protein TonB
MAVETDSRWRRAGTVSAVVHVLAIAALVHTWLFWARPMPPAGSSHGTRRMLVYLPGRPAVSAEVGKKGPARLRPVPKRTPLLTYKVPDETASMAVPVAPSPESMEGNDALGRGRGNIARVQAFPASRPDLSKLAVGSADVVVDVEIDDTGRVASARARKGMGHGIDEMVIATVEQWLFYPATKHGRPVASEQELHFHYDRGPGAQPCGWDCFELTAQ